MTDLSKTIEPKSDQLNSDDLIGGPRTITVTKVSADPSSAEQPVNIYFQGDNNKPFKPCKSMRRVLVHCWGVDGSAYAGRSMTLFRDPEVTWGGMKVGGIRISHMSGIDGAKTMALTANKQQRKPYKVLPLTDAPSTTPQVDLAAVIPALELASSEGMDALEASWKSLTKDERKAASSQMPRLKKIAAAKDEPAPKEDDEPDPFADQLEGADLS